MRRVVLCNFLCVLANVKSSCAMRAPQPNTSYLVRVDVAKGLAMQNRFEVSCRVGGINRIARRDVAYASFV